MQPNKLGQQTTELLIRIVLQNLLLLAAAILFAVCVVMAVVMPQSGWSLALVHCAISAALLVQWCHHGVRTMQLKAYVVAQEAGQSGTWEVWLPAHRPKSLLGSRWMIATKGVFLGTQGALIIFAAASATDGAVWKMVLCGLGFITSAFLLFTNPKE